MLWNEIYLCLAFLVTFLGMLGLWLWVNKQGRQTKRFLHRMYSRGH